MMKVIIMILGVLVTGGIVATIIGLLSKIYNRDQQERDERVLVLEKRINDLKKELIWQIQWQEQLEKQFERDTKDELTRIKKQLKKKSDDYE